MLKTVWLHALVLHHVVPTETQRQSKNVMWSHKPHLIQYSSPRHYNAFIKLQGVCILWNTYHHLVVTYIIRADNTDKILSRQGLHISYVFQKKPHDSYLFHNQILFPVSPSHVGSSSLWVLLLTFWYCYKWYQREENLGTIHFCPDQCQHVHKSAAV